MCTHTVLFYQQNLNDNSFKWILLEWICNWLDDFCLIDTYYKEIAGCIRNHFRYLTFYHQVTEVINESGIAFVEFGAAYITSHPNIW